MMYKKRISLLLACVLLLSLCSCDLNFTGTMLMLDQYPADKLLEQYEQYASGEKEVEYLLDKRIPVLEGFIQSTKGVEDAVTVKFCVSNKGFYDVIFYGSIWVVTGKDHEIATKAKYYNTERKVANADYQIRLDADHSCNFIYSMMDEYPDLDENTLIFFFFHYDDTDYVASLDFEDNIIFWPLSTSKSADVT